MRSNPLCALMCKFNPANHKIKSNRSFFSLHYAEASNKFARTISALLRLRATQLLLKKDRSGGFSAPETNALPFDQLIIIKLLYPKSHKR